MKAYSAPCTGQGKLFVKAYLSASDAEESDVKVRVISRMALFTSMIEVAVSRRNMRRIMMKTTRRLNQVSEARVGVTPSSTVVRGESNEENVYVGLGCLLISLLCMVAGIYGLL